MAETKSKESDQARKETISASEALSYIGARVDDSAGMRLGKVSGVHVDANTEEPVWLIVRIGRFAGDAAIPFDHTAPVAGRVWVAYERNEIRNSPKLSAGQSLSAKQELQLCDHYGIRSGVGRAAVVEELEADEISAVPATE